MSSVLYMPVYVVRDNEVDLGPQEYGGGNLSLPLNFSEEYEPKPHHAMFYVMFAVNCFTSTAGLVGNLLLVLTYGRHTSTRTSTNTYILSIAVTDLLVTLTCAAVPIITDLAGTWPLGETACKLSQATMEFSTFATVLTLTAISVERYYAVVYPIERYISTRRCTLLVNIAVWLVALFCSIPKYMNSGIRRHRVAGSRGYTVVSYCVIHQDRSYFVSYLSLVDFIVFYSIPLCIVCGLYTSIYRRLMRITMEVTTKGHMSTAQVHQARLRYKVAKMVIVLSAIFFVGFLPHNILIMRIFLLGKADAYWNSAASYAYCYGCLHFWLNPIALYVCSDTVRRHFNELLLCGPRSRKKHTTTQELQLRERV